MTIKKLFPSGAWCVTDMVGAHLVQRVYYGYTKREALREARTEFKSLRKVHNK